LIVRRPIVLLATMCLAIGGAALASAPSAPRVGPIPQKVREELKLDPFYQQYLDDHGLAIVGSAKVNRYAFLEAKYILDHMLSHRPEIREALIREKLRIAIMAYTEMTTDIPEQSNLKPKAYWDRRARGLGGAPVTSCGEENLLRFPGDPYFQESIFIHEFSHAVHQVAMARIDRTFDARLTKAYEQARAKGLWKDSYAGSNPAEYFAEGAQAWFNAGRPGGGANSGIDTREKLKRYDASLASLCQEVYGDGSWRYVPPDHRQDPGPLAGMDRATLPRFVWPGRKNFPTSKPAPRSSK
jgi:hypothetical protein